jgi:hypothetical protein
MATKEYSFSMRALRCAAVMTFVLFASSLALATSAYKVDLEQLTAQSDLVVHATVAKIESRWNDDRSRIVTEIELKVSDTYKGSAVTSPLIIRQPGGQVGDIGQKVSGLATFSPDEEVVVFLKKRGPAFTVTSWAQGKYKVTRSSDGKTAFAVPEDQDAQLVDPKTHVPVNASSKAVELKAFKDKVKKIHASQTAKNSGGGKP